MGPQRGGPSANSTARDSLGEDTVVPLGTEKAGAAAAAAHVAGTATGSPTGAPPCCSWRDRGDGLLPGSRGPRESVVSNPAAAVTAKESPPLLLTMVKAAALPSGPWAPAEAACLRRRTTAQAASRWPPTSDRDEAVVGPAPESTMASTLTHVTAGSCRAAGGGRGSEG